MVFVHVVHSACEEAPLGQQRLPEGDLLVQQKGPEGDLLTTPERMDLIKALLNEADIQYKLLRHSQKVRTQGLPPSVPRKLSKADHWTHPMQTACLTSFGDKVEEQRQTGLVCVVLRQSGALDAPEPPQDC